MNFQSEQESGPYFVICVTCRRSPTNYRLVVRTTTSARLRHTTSYMQSKMPPSQSSSSAIAIPKRKKKQHFHHRHNRNDSGSEQPEPQAAESPAVSESLMSSSGRSSYGSETSPRNLGKSPVSGTATTAPVPIPVSPAQIDKARARRSSFLSEP